MSAHAKDSDLPITTTSNMVKISDSSEAHQDFRITSSGRKRKFEEFKELEDESTPSRKNPKFGKDMIDLSMSRTEDIHSGIDSLKVPKKNSQSSTDPALDENYEMEGTLNHEEEEPIPNLNSKFENGNKNEQQNPETITKIHQTLKEFKEESTSKEPELQDEEQIMKDILEKERQDSRPWDERLYRCIDDPPSDSPTLMLGKDLLGGRGYMDIVTGVIISVAIGTPGRILDDKEKDLWEQYAREMGEAALMPIPDSDDDM